MCTYWAKSYVHRFCCSSNNVNCYLLGLGHILNNSDSHSTASSSNDCCRYCYHLFSRSHGSHCHSTCSNNDWHNNDRSYCYYRNYWHHSRNNYSLQCRPFQPSIVTNRRARQIQHQKEWTCDHKIRHCTIQTISTSNSVFILSSRWTRPFVSTWWDTVSHLEARWKRIVSGTSRLPWRLSCGNSVLVQHLCWIPYGSWVLWPSALVFSPWSWWWMGFYYRQWSKRRLTTTPRNFSEPHETTSTPSPIQVWDVSEGQ